QTRMLHGQTRYNLPSRFFDEIPEELLKWLTPRMGRTQAAVPQGLTFAAPRRGGWGGPAPDVAVSRTLAKETGGFRIGQNVAHARFGQGVIVNAEGAGSDARVQVNFGREGVKWLALSVAKLTAA
ncbi:MAG: DNA helicase II, partial [Rhodocyclaceae bacterium]|nr:DNA helicase II [Rhodocyclaceae bacterium]